MVWGKSGKSQFFLFEKPDHVLDGERASCGHVQADQGRDDPQGHLLFLAAMPK